MDPRLFLTVAQTLVESVRPSSTAPSRPCEAECRSAAGRAYYAAFLTAHEFLFWTGVRVLKNAGCHTGVQYALNNSGHAILRQVATALNTLAEFRRAADYDMQDGDVGRVAQADHIVQSGRTAILLLDALRNPRSATPFDRAAVANSILAYAAQNGQANIQRR